ncbi:uncharacterized protein LOC114243372, partial [Bombyx mandarina]|uniref:Uncharacterized protein LOC114243372 n=1 Tax=Bombyx mandarina TaxID=7092 RepID=A0A6J2JMX0_BOMMA
MDSCKKILPQEGTSRSAGGESLRASEQSDARCPSYSGGGTNCHDEEGGSTSRVRERVPIVLLERCDSVVSLRSTRSSARGCVSSGRDSPRLLTLGSAGKGEKEAGRIQRKRKTVKRPTSPAPLDSSEGEPMAAKFLAIEEGPANATASLANSKSTRNGLVATGSVQTRAACRRAKNTVEQLQAQNAGLLAENLELRAEVAALHMRVDELIAELRNLTPPDGTEVAELKRRFAILEARSSPVERARPPLAHERKAAAQAKPQSAGLAKLERAQLSRATVYGPAGRQTPVQPARPQPTAANTRQAVKVRPGRSRTKKKGNVNAAKPVPPPQPHPLPPAPSSMDVAWTEVVKRGNKNKKRVPAAARPQPAPAAAAPHQEGRVAAQGKNKRRRNGKPRAPRSAAVVLELLPAAKEKGITYMEVMSRARGAVDVDAIGVEGGLKVRHTANGARLLECPGAQSGAAADRLVARLREILPDPEIVRIERPVKMAEVKLTGLDECATQDEVAAAIASQGNCALAHVKVGELRSTYSGARTAWARCPVQAAILLATPPSGKPANTPGRLRVGWIMAQVQLQEARPWRCLRCFGTGHGLAKCPSTVDRSGLCFRCGQSGHKAATCTAVPHCVLCDAAKRQADHRAGGPACRSAPSSTKRRRGGKN